MRISGLVATRGGEQAATAFPQTPPTFLQNNISEIKHKNVGKASYRSIPANTANLFTQLPLFHLNLDKYIFTIWTKTFYIMANTLGQIHVVRFLKHLFTHSENFHCSILGFQDM